MTMLYPCDTQSSGFCDAFTSVYWLTTNEILISEQISPVQEYERLASAQADWRRKWWTFNISYRTCCGLIRFWAWHFRSAAFSATIFQMWTSAKASHKMRISKTIYNIHVSYDATQLMIEWMFFTICSHTENIVSFYELLSSDFRIALVKSHRRVAIFTRPLYENKWILHFHFYL